MSKKAAYREFLKSKFWRDLSEEKKRITGGKCQECGGSECLQSHHIRYPRNWFDTTVDDLKVLCRECHRRAHGIVHQPFIVYSGRGYKFSRTIWRVDATARRLYCGDPLSDRELLFLRLAALKYPPTQQDGCMNFHVQNCLETNRILHS